jgi:tetratricopeptide (TPR) repeat protein
MKTYRIFNICLLLLLLALISFNCKRPKTEKQTETNIPIDTTPYILNIPDSLKDSTDIYGTGNFDYRDTLETYHRGYSIPRDSLYKVYNIKAFEELNLIIQKDPTKPGPFLDRGNHFQNIKMYREAINDYNEYIKRVSTNQSAYMNRGNAYERLKQYDSALSDYKMVIFLKPDDTIANFNKGNIYDMRAQYDSALKQYDSVIIKDPRLAKGYYNRGATYAAMKNYQMAIKDWETAIMLNRTYESELFQKINRVKRLMK